MSDYNFAEKACSWTLAVLLFNLITGRLPFGPRHDMPLYSQKARECNFTFTKQDKAQLSPVF